MNGQPTVILIPSLVILSEAKDLGSAFESRNTGILRFAQNDTGGGLLGRPLMLFFRRPAPIIFEAGEKAAVNHMSYARDARGLIGD